ncbi:hypothetical protein ACJ41O_015337 [Fusarium nematophilum]
MSKPSFPGPRLAKITQIPLRYHELRGNREGFINGLHKAHGEVVQIAPKTLSVNDPSAVRDAFATPRARPAPIPFLHNYGVENLVSTVGGRLHQERRRPLRTLYSARAAESLEFRQLSSSVTKQLLSYADLEARNGAVELKPMLRFALYDIMSQVVYGTKNATNLLGSPTQREAIKPDMKFQEDRIEDWTVAIAILLPNLTLKLRRWGIAPKRLDGRFPNDLYTDRMGRTALNGLQNGETIDSEGSESLIRRMFEHYRANGPSSAMPSTDYILSDCMDHFWAGVNTTLDGLVATFSHLSKPENRNRQARLREELLAAEREARDGLSADLRKLPFLNAVIRESLRLNPPIPFSMERLVSRGESDIVLQGHSVPAGWTISAQPVSMHSKESIYPRPDEWIPERWQDANQCQERDMTKAMKRHFFAFGSGSRMCIGANVAWSVMRGVLAETYRHVETDMEEGHIRFLEVK